MSENDQLLSKISRLAGHINRQRDRPRNPQGSSITSRRTPDAELHRRLGSPGIQRQGYTRPRHALGRPVPVTTASSVDSAPSSSAVPAGRVHRLSHEGLQYIVTDEGRMLVRDTNFGDSTQITPEILTIHGVSFEKNKHGHLLRQDASSNARLKTSQQSELCRRFTTTGRCSRGPQCIGIHDPTKVAICRDFLKNGNCPRGTQCDLSHTPSYERVPSCVHFLRGSCSKESCPYPHVKVNEAAPVCNNFARIGFCEEGVDCMNKHVFECPDYTNTGKCKDPKCRLPHIDKASQLRQREPGAKSMDQAGQGFSLSEMAHGQKVLPKDLAGPEDDYGDTAEGNGAQEEFIPLG